ncbi:hypothetical protein Q0Z83_016850 [Actinoplanes sichuanensis]|uniref:Uncharacterized protein n=1 Tax=Actinoplanes sichuanensis TaxID=512349 RepID=A0ABW4A6U6_9ACTN|nr:hypothetical protein [Actinoplanes sichuanensis]BEL03494.1 hypothetical protein Q0Z83_016850 [Actinoplanes sichuanensis]
MSARAARLSAVPFVLLAFVLRFVESLWLQPLTWRFESDAAGFLAAILMWTTTLGVPLGIFLLVTRKARKRPVAWDIGATGRRFTAEPAVAGTGVRAVFIGWLAGGLVPTERVPGEERKRIAELGSFTTVMTVLAVVFLLVAIWLVVGRWPWLALDREAVTFRRVFRTTRTPWDDLPADLVDLKIPGPGLHIDPRFLGFSIHTYQHEPARREEIGTEAEATRLALAHQP